MSQAIIECVPNFSEGRNEAILQEIAKQVRSVAGVALLDIDPGKDTNRTVFTFAGPPEAVCEAAFRAIGAAAELIDMSKHTGTHPRMGATDVCPLIPISGISLEEVNQWAQKLAARVAEAYSIPIYMYEASAKSEDRRNLANIRSGEYEGFSEKIKLPEWSPDYGTAKFNTKSGATVIGARDFLIAYNVNLNTKSVKKANSIAFDVREKGRVKKAGKKIVLDSQGNEVREPGTLKNVKAIGWYMPEYGFAQISMNLTNPSQTPIHEAFEAVEEKSRERGIRVTGSELVGMVPKKAFLEAGKYFQRKQKSNPGLTEHELIRIAVRSLGLEELGPFEMKQKIIEYAIENKEDRELIDLSMEQFADRLASDSPAPGGGSAAAYTGALGASLGTMVASLSQAKKGFEKQWEMFAEEAEKGQILKQQLLHLVDADTAAFSGIIQAVRLPKSTLEEIDTRTLALHEATKIAIETPLQTMRIAYEAIDLIAKMVTDGIPSSVSDAAVGGLCLDAAIKGANYNVRINLKDFADEVYSQQILAEADSIMSKSAPKLIEIERNIKKIINL